MANRRIILAAFACLSTAACTDAAGTIHTVERQGFTRVSITGYRFFGCGEDDVFRTGFEAMAPNGERVTGVVCSGWLKGYTLRLD